MRNTITRLTSKGQVTIPVEIRRVLGLAPRDRVHFSLENGVATVRKVESQLDKIAGSVKSIGGPIDFKKLRAEVKEDISRRVVAEM